MCILICVLIYRCIFLYLHRLSLLPLSLSLSSLCCTFAQIALLRCRTLFGPTSCARLGLPVCYLLICLVARLKYVVAYVWLHISYLVVKIFWFCCAHIEG